MATSLASSVACIMLALATTAEMNEFCGQDVIVGHIAPDSRAITASQELTNVFVQQNQVQRTCNTCTERHLAKVVLVLQSRLEAFSFGAACCSQVTS